MDGFAVGVLFEENHEGAVDRVFVMQNRLYKRPKRQSLRFKASVAIKLLGNILIFFIARWLKKKKQK